MAWQNSSIKNILHIFHIFFFHFFLYTKICALFHHPSKNSSFLQRPSSQASQCYGSSRNIPAGSGGRSVRFVILPERVRFLLRGPLDLQSLLTDRHRLFLALPKMGINVKNKNKMPNGLVHVHAHACSKTSKFWHAYMNV